MFCLPIVACGGNVDNGSDQENSTGLGGAGFNGAAVPGGRGGSTGGSNSTLPGGITPLTPTAWSQIDNSACAGLMAQVRNVTGFIIDSSSSMNSIVPSTNGNTKWQVVQNVLTSTIASLPNNMATGLLVYPNEPTTPNLSQSPLPIDTCVNTSAAVSIQTLGPAPSTQRDAIVNGLANVTPQGGTPTQDAYTYALNNLLLPALPSYPGTVPYLVLITDGQPTISAGCQGADDEQIPVDTSPLIAAISSALTFYAVDTAVVGLPGSEQSSANGADGRVWLSDAAEAGNTRLTSDCSDSGVPNYCHHDLSQVSDLQTSLQEALQTILGVPLPCSFTIPPPVNGGVVDPNHISVVYTMNSQTSEMYLIGQSDPACTQGDGWYVSPDKSQIELCAKTCSTIQQYATQITILAGCYPVPHPT